MKRFFLFALAATALAACSTDTTQDLAPEIPTSPDELYVSFDEDSRVQLDADCKTVWTKDDLVSVFYYSDANDCWRFKGETGDRNGLLIRKTSTTPTIVTDEVVVVYPYNADYRLATSDKTLSVRIPAVQHYEAGSYGVGANLMVSTGTSNNFSLKSVCGWIKLQFTGSGKVTKVTLRGNDDEQIAGLATINYADYSLSLIADGLGDAANNDEVGGTLVDDADYVREITLDCGEGIALNNKTPTAFYFVLAPQTFTQGITITATCDDGTEITKSTENAITIERNHILPMASATLEMPIPSNQIWYTSSDGNVVEPYSGNLNSNATAMQTFGANIVSNTYENGVGVITFDGDVTTIGNWAFGGCSALKSITIPNSVTSIGNKAFYNCSALKEVYCKPTTPPTGGSYMFDSNASGRKIYVPKESVEAYRSAEGWSDYKYVIEDIDSAGVHNPKLMLTENSPQQVEVGTAYKSHNVEIIANVDYEVIIPSDVDWITLYKTQKKEGYDIITLSIKANLTLSARSATVTFQEVDGSLSTSVTFDQSFFAGFDDSALDPNKYLTYVANRTSTGYGDAFDYNIYIKNTYFEANVNSSNAVIAEYKFKLPEGYTFPGGSTYATVADDVFKIDNSQIRVVGNSYREDGEWYTDWTTYNLASLGVTITDILTIRLDSTNNTATINGRTVSNGNIKSVISSYIFSSYYHDSDDGVYEEYGAFVENARLYYVKAWDNLGRLVYLGHADKATNSNTGNVEACWKSQSFNTSVTDSTTFANYKSEDYKPLGMGNM